MDVVTIVSIAINQEKSRYRTAGTQKKKTCALNVEDAGSSPAGSNLCINIFKVKYLGSRRCSAAEIRTRDVVTKRRLRQSRRGMCKWINNSGRGKIKSRSTVAQRKTYVKRNEELHFIHTQEGRKCERNYLHRARMRYTKETGRIVTELSIGG